MLHYKKPTFKVMNPNFLKRILGDVNVYNSMLLCQQERSSVSSMIIYEAYLIIWQVLKLFQFLLL